MADSILETVHPQYPGALASVVRPGFTFPNDDSTIDRFRVRAIGTFPSGANAIIGHVVPAGQTDPTDFALQMLDTTSFYATYVIPQVQQTDLASMPAEIAATVGAKIPKPVEAEPAQQVQSVSPAP